jgi:hypothetical protein
MNRGRATRHRTRAPQCRRAARERMLISRTASRRRTAGAVRRLSSAVRLNQRVTITGVPMLTRL